MGHPSRRLQEAFAEHVFEEARQAPSTSHVRIIFFPRSSMISTGILQSMWLFVVCCFSRSAYWLPTRKKRTHAHTRLVYQLLCRYYQIFSCSISPILKINVMFLRAPLGCHMRTRSDTVKHPSSPSEYAGS